MQEEARTKLTGDVLDLMDSFQEAISRAGGTLRVCDLRDMSIDELFSLLATNRIHFTWKGPDSRF